MIIKLIGLRRLVILLVSFSMSCFLAVGYFWGLVPMRERALAEQTELQGQITDLQTKITVVKQDVIDVRSNLPKYAVLEKEGLFERQDRFELQKKLKELQTKAVISGFSFNVKDVETLPNADADMMGHNLINSRVTLEKISSTFDEPLYDLLRGIPAVFPQHARVQEISIQRSTTNKIDPPTLQKISAGQKIGFIEATISFDWMTLIPKEAAVPEETDPNAQGFRGR